MGTDGQMIKASAIYAEGHGLESRAGILLDFFLSKFNYNTLGWNTVPSFLYMIFS